MISDEIRAKVDEAERRLAKVGVPWSIQPMPHDSADLLDCDGSAVTLGSDVIGALAPPEAELIVSVVNRERAQIEHARDVMGRHLTCTLYSCGCHWSPDGEPCPEILSLARAWGVQA